MTARITTVAFAGVEVLDVDVQVGSGLPVFAMKWSNYPNKFVP